MFNAAWHVEARRTRYLTGWSIPPAHELRQLGAGADAQLGERIVDVGFHRMQERCSCAATSRLVTPWAIRLTTV